MRWPAVVIAALIFAPAAAAQYAPAQALGNTEARLIHYVAHDGVRRAAWLLLPITESRRAIALVISPHGRGVGAEQNALFWGDLPGEGDFAVINPAGEGRRLHWFSWGAPGQIADLARMPAIARAGRRRCCSPRFIPTCWPERRPSTRRPTCGVGISISRP